MGKRRTNGAKEQRCLKEERIIALLYGNEEYDK